MRDPTGEKSCKPAFLRRGQSCWTQDQELRRKVVLYKGWVRYEHVEVDGGFHAISVYTGGVHLGLDLRMCVCL